MFPRSLCSSREPDKNWPIAWDTELFRLGKNSFLACVISVFLVYRQKNTYQLKALISSVSAVHILNTLKLNTFIKAFETVIEELQNTSDYFL